MSSCLCCAKDIPATAQKVCPVCGHAFTGKGWGGMDAHWKAKHERLMPYAEFWAGMCERHRGSSLDGDLPAKQVAPPVDSTPPLGNAYTQALALRSSHVENILTHALVAAIGQELWRRDPRLDFQVFNAEVDDSGFDLVLGCNGAMRYIQIKQTHLQGNAVKYSMRLDFARMPGACAVVLVFEGNSLRIDHCLFYGGSSREPMPPIEAYPISVSPGRRTVDGTRKVRDNYRDVPRRAFEGPLTIAELVDRLFS